MGGLKNQFSQGLFQASAYQMEEIGTLRILQDGRKFRYLKAVASALAPGKMSVAPAAVANHINRAMNAAADVGDTQLSITVGATAVTADQYKEGFLQVNDGTGEGRQYKIVGNTACDASGTTIVQLEEPITEALEATTSEVSLIPNKYGGVVHSATEENVPTGVPTTTIPANNFGWAQTGGQGICLISGTPAVGTPLTLAGTAGALTGCSSTAATLVTQPICAEMLATAGVTTEYKPVNLKID